MADRKVKAWAVWSPSDKCRDIHMLRKEANESAEMWNEAAFGTGNPLDYKVSPCTIVIHTPAKPKRRKSAPSPTKGGRRGK